MPMTRPTTLASPQSKRMNDFGMICEAKSIMRQRRAGDNTGKRKVIEEVRERRVPSRDDDSRFETKKWKRRERGKCK